MILMFSLTNRQKKMLLLIVLSFVALC